MKPNDKIIEDWIEMKIWKDLQIRIQIENHIILTDYRNGKIGIGENFKTEILDNPRMLQYVRSLLDALRNGQPTLEEMNSDIELFLRENQV